MDKKNTNKKKNVRVYVLKALANFYKNSGYSDIVLDNILTENALDKQDSAFVTRIFYGVIEKRLYLDFFLSKLIVKDLKHLDSYVLNILRAGIYEIEFMNSIPENATCFEYVEIVKKYNKSASGFVNGVLRSFIRQKESLKSLLNALPETEKISILYSMPSNLVNLWREQYGADVCLKLAESFSCLPDTFLTVNTLKTSVEDFSALLKNKGIAHELSKYSSRGIKLTENIPVHLIDGYNEGLFFVQDEASQICAAEIEAGAGDFVIDVCAAPGGKSFYTAINMENKGKILSFDLHENKVSLIKENAKKLGIEILKAERNDSRKLREDLIGKADKVLCDVPCSGYGVINKKPEIKYKDYGDFSSLVKTQYEILNTSSQYVKENGTLIYSTCTLNKKENEEMIFEFLKKNPSFKCVEFVNNLNSQFGMKTFFPYIEKIDGFFLVKMIRCGV